MKSAKKADSGWSPRTAGREPSLKRAAKKLRRNCTSCRRYGASVAGGKVGKFHVSYDASVFNLGSDAAETFRVPNLAEPLSEAIIEPPAPFSGTATFHLETPKKANWTGDLAVELPGLGTVPLTGPKIAAGLCHGRDCTKTLPRLAQRALEARGGDLSTYFVGDDTGKAPEKQSIR